MALVDTGWKVKIAQCLVLLLSSAVILLGNAIGPPEATTGDFGEPSCNQSGCHQGNPLNASGGSLTITGVPTQYQPGTTYPISVTLGRTGQRRWGFELAVRFAGNSQQAGTIVVTNSNLTQVRTKNGIQYISHNPNLASTFPTNPGPVTWSFNWVAPAAAQGAIRFSSAGNAANNDSNNTGDFIYTTSVTTNPVAISHPLTAIFSQVAVGGGFDTIFTLTNTGTGIATGDLIITDQQGNPFNVDLSEPGIGPEAPSGEWRINAVGSTFSVSIPEGGLRVFKASAASPGDPQKSGWARVQSTGGSLGGVATFQFVQEGILKTIAGVLASLPVPVATIPVDDFNPSDFVSGRATGYAVANPNNENINIRIVVVDETGRIVETLRPALLNPLVPRGQVARFLWQDQSPLPPSFKGSMVLISQGGQSFSVVALVLNKGLFTAIPVIPEKAGPIN